MVVDTSALIAVLLGEPDAGDFARALADAPVRLLSALSRVELSFVIEGRKGETGRADVDLLLRDGGFDIVSVTPRRRRRVSPLRPRPPSGTAKRQQ